MRQSGLNVTANVPYRRETFSTKAILLDFDGDFNMAEAGEISSDARSKGLTRILHDLDSIREFNDSVGHAYYHDAKSYTFNIRPISKTDSLKIVKELAKEETNIDTLYLKLKGEQKQAVIRQAASDAQMALSNLDFKSEYSYYLNREERMHHPLAVVSHLLLHWSTIGCDYPKRWTGCARHHLCICVHRLLHP